MDLQPPERLRAILAALAIQQLNLHNHLALLLLVRQLDRQRQRRRRRRQRRFWVRPWIGRRHQLGTYSTLMAELQRESRGDFASFLRMEPRMFHELLQRVTPRIRRSVTRFRRPLEPGLRLAITLRYLATGDTYHSLMFQFRVPHNTISLLVPEVCQAILDEYEDEVFNCPTTPDGWRAIAELFSSRWNFHHCCGAIDGKHIAIKCPKKSGSVYYNYKGYYSIVLLAVVDANYKFIWANVGSPGSASDAGIFNDSPLPRSLETNTIGFPDADPLPHDNVPMPYFIVGDDAFALRTWLMKPFSHRNMLIEDRIFNYRLSRARRIVENAFGILAHRWRCLLSRMQMQPDNCTIAASAAITLHNLMRIRYPALQNLDVDQEDIDHTIVPGAWRTPQVLQDVNAIQGGNRATRLAKQQRIALKHYYNGVGAVPWQDDII